MRDKEVLIVAIIILTFLFAVLTQPSNANEVFAPEVKVKASIGHGTGFHIRNGLFITAAHVVEGKKTDMEVITRTGRVFHAERLWVNGAYDIAAFRVAEGVFLESPMDCSGEHPIGLKVTTVGYPFNMPYVVNFGAVSNGVPQRLDKWKSVFVVGSSGGSGMSGSPVRRTDNGHVVGVLVAGLGRHSSMMLAAPASVVCMFMGQ